MKTIFTIKIKKRLVAYLMNMFILLFGFSSGIFAQLNGSYTLGDDGVYSSFAEAFDVLQTQGVSGPVTFNVIPGTYNEQVVYRQVPGASVNNPILFQSASGDSSDVTVQSAAATNTENYVMKLDSASYVSFRSISFRSTNSTYSNVIVFKNIADHATFSHCVFQGHYYPYGDANRVLIYSSITRINSLLLENNDFSQSSYGVYLQGASNDLLGAIEIKNNRFDSLGYIAVLLNYAGNPVITGNSITHGSNGVWLSGSSGNINISGNRIAMDLQGITLAYVNYYSSDNKYALISNNMIATNRNDVTNPGGGGIYLHHSDHVKVYFNTSVYYINKWNNSIAIKLSSCEGSSIEVVNNNLVCLHDGYAFYSDQNTGALARCDNNNYYTAGTVLGVWAGTDCNDLSALKTTSGDNAHSVSADPGFVSDTDLHVTSAVLDSAGVLVQGITEDIDGDIRDPQYPDIGADEFGAAPSNFPPVAVNDTVEVVQGNDVVIAVLDNDSDPDGDPIHVTGTGTPAEGQVTGIANDTVKYLIPMDFTGMDSVIYTIRDTNGLKDSAWIFINVVVSSNHPPVAVNDYAVVLQGGQVSVDLLLNDYDPDGDSIYVSQLHSFIQGSAVLTDNHYIVYTAPENYTGVDSLEYILEDIHEAIGVAWVYITVKAESFEPSDIELDPLSLGVGVWGDYDTDGDMDILTGGVTTGNAYEVKLYENDNGSFTSSSVITQVAPEQFDAVAWGDFDNDGDPDLIVSGYENTGIIRTPRTRLFQVENGEIPEIISGINMNNAGSVDWGDYDNDGDLDLLTGGSIARVYRNDGAGEADMWVFTDVKTLPQAREGSAKWGDYDSDGDLDILLSSTSVSGTKLWLYKNTGNGEFSEINTGIEDVRGRCIWYDYNHDGYPDIIFEGRRNDTLATTIYRNEPDGTGRKFTDIDAGLKGLEAGSISFCDYDLDGDADLLVTGRDTEGKSWTILYDYLSDGRFMESGVTLPGVEWGNGKWGDFNGDGKPDLLLLGYRNDPGNPGVNGAYTGVFINKTSGTNTPPTTPTNLSVDITGTSVMLSWSPATDLKTLAKGLTYNLRMGTTSEGVEVMSAMADPATGTLYVPETGNIGYNLQWKINNLQLGRNYWWSVQAIDPSYAGSLFSQEKSFKMEGEYFAENPLLVLQGLTFGDVAWGDYDNDGDPDLAMSGMTSEGSYVSAIYRNNEGAFTDIGVSLQGVWKSSLDWGDYDNDGDIDLLLTGNTSENVLSGVAKIYRNDGNNTFTDINAVLINAGDGDAVWGDYDNDGDLDILITGNYTNEIKVSKIFINNNGEFQLDTDAGLKGVSNSSVAWGDYDKDGDLDILLSGLNNSGFPMTKIFRNDTGVFTEDSNVHLPNIYNGSVAWEDYNNDGALDILFTGTAGDGVYKTRIFRNDMNSHFTEIDAQLDEVDDASIVWGDMDADGRSDIIMASSSSTCLYLNTPSGFHKKSVLPGINHGSLAVADYNKDGRLDFVMSGENAENEHVCKIYYNINTSNHLKNLPPEAPDGLTATNEDSGIVFHWNKGNDRETPSDGLSYNLRIGTTPGGSGIMSAMADIDSGIRKVTQTGNVNQNCSWKIRGLETGTTYYWSVQAIDHNFCGSVFASEQTVTHVPSHKVSGEIFLYSEMPVTMARVYAYSINEDGWISNIVSSIVSETNQYELPEVPEGKITVEVYPTPGAYPDYLPTYLGNTALYARADRFILDKDTTVEDIYLVHKPQSSSGAYYVFGGLACNGEGCTIHTNPHYYPNKSAQIDTTALSNVYTYLINSEGDIVAYDITDSLGNFSIDSIPGGKYFLYIDYMGLPMAVSNDSILLNEDHQKYEISAVAEETDITITLSDVTDVKNPDFNRNLIVFPNPVQDVLYLKFDGTSGEDIRIRLIRMDGSVYKMIQTETVQENTTFSIPVSDLPAGLYILSVENKNISYKKRFVKLHK